MHDLHGKVALVIGAASKLGIGRAVALRLAGDGADVAVADRHLVPKAPLLEEYKGWRGLGSVVAEIEGLGRKGLAIVADVSSSKEVNKMVEDSLATFGKIDILVNVAAIPGKRGVHVVDLDEETWNRVLAVNVTASFLVCKAVAKSMIERGGGGKIILTSSREAKLATPGMAPYVTSKIGLIGLTRTLALELAPHKINVNVICPGLTVTGVRDEYAIEEARRLGITPEEAKAQFYARTAASVVPLGRAATAEDIANVFAFLASSDSDYMTGQAINVTGGRVMH